LGRELFKRILPKPEAWGSLRGGEMDSGFEMLSNNARRSKNKGLVRKVGVLPIKDQGE